MEQPYAWQAQKATGEGEKNPYNSTPEFPALPYFSREN